MRIDFDTAKPREIEAYLREQIRKALGDATENRSTVYAKRGYYTVHLFLDKRQRVDFTNFRKTEAPQIAKAIRALKA